MLSKRGGRAARNAKKTRQRHSTSSSAGTVVDVDAPQKSIDGNPGSTGK